MLNYFIFLIYALKLKITEFSLSDKDSFELDSLIVSRNSGTYSTNLSAIFYLAALSQLSVRCDGKSESVLKESSLIVYLASS